MLARQFTLRETKNFERVEAQGKMFQSESFGLGFFNREDSEPSRFGFIVSTKISKEAVQRNRIKRALSEAVRYEMAYLKPGHDAVFLAKGVSTKKSTDALMHEVKEALGKAGLTK
ncbi:ribonuclease P protein component [Candidatus Woesebacteria bacterium RIFCSPHIGHO2_12_FULL_46_16]|uniref:Ribonuclease P protein component n=1 Tax=Candidatus Woesebacteria bacterium RIFCSPHIGHO2_12_FULL_46_16 TaxID=1802513 RepID=A0A1F8AXH9_9BACT|nr:MAG: ribonuclease P protein component [Candidatus Woesebacteria bacterium RIFCSPHIGHO2_12_FULL_46_16]